MHNIIRRYIQPITLLISIFLSACASSPEPDQNSGKSLDMVLYDRAREAFQAGNYKSAASLFDPLAEKGNADAQYSLGYLYYHGKGVDKNLNRAMHWFSLSARQGNQNAIEALNTIRNMLKQQTESSNRDSTASSRAQSYAAPANTQTNIIDLRQQTQPATGSLPADNNTQPSPVTTEPQPVPQAQTQPSSIPESNDRPASRQPTVTAEPAVPAEPAAEPPIGATEKQHRKWIMQQPRSHYTIQLASGTRKKHIIAYVRNVKLDGVYFYRARSDSTMRYYVIHGSFDTFTKAQRKLRLLHKRGYKDAWIKGMEGIQARLQQ